MAAKAKSKYNNLNDDKKRWNSNATKDSKIVALTTQVEELKKKWSNKNKGGGGKDNGPGSRDKVKLDVAEWRKTNNLGAKVTKDGKDWWWCPHQHNGGKGLYVTHPPDKHVEWQERRSKRGKDDKSKDGKPSGGKFNKNMTLSDNLKAAMVSKFKCTEAEASSIWENVSKNSGN